MTPYVGADLHRRRSVIVLLTLAGLWPEASTKSDLATTSATSDPLWASSPSLGGDRNMSLIPSERS